MLKMLLLALLPISSLGMQNQPTLALNRVRVGDSTVSGTIANAGANALVQILRRKMDGTEENSRATLMNGTFTARLGSEVGPGENVFAIETTSGAKSAITKLPQIGI